MPISEMSDITGQQTMANSASVVVASDQTVIPISAASLPLPTGASTAANQATGNASLAAIDAGIPVALGQTTMSASMPVTIASDQTSLPIVYATSPKATYSAGISALAIAAAATTDVFIISGSATKTVKVTVVSFSGADSAMKVSPLFLIKRSTANTGGTSTTLTNVPYDSTDAAGTAVVKAYTANPTLGTAVGTIRSTNAGFYSNGNGVPPNVIWAFGTASAKPIILRGTAENLVLNLNGATVGGTTPTLDLFVEWTEE